MPNTEKSRSSHLYMFFKHMDISIIIQEKELKIAVPGEEEMGVGERGLLLFYNKFVKPFDKNS